MVDPHGRPTHPIFVPYGITSRSPLLESDYNLHKSNSTYFSDLDIARTALVARLYTPGIYMVSKEVERELLASAEDKGKEKDGSNEKAIKEAKSYAKKAIYVAVGSVYCAFKREVKPFELFEVQSKIIAWDQKWLYIMSFFLRPAPGGKGKQTLLATALTKYVVKKGRLTIPPARVLRTNGLLPSLPECVADKSASSELSSVDKKSLGATATATATAMGIGTGTPANASGEQEVVDADADDGSSLERKVLTISDDDAPDERVLAEKKKANAESSNASEWSYEMIEQERRRGMHVVEGYAHLDAKVHAEWEGAD